MKIIKNNGHVEIWFSSTKYKTIIKETIMNEGVIKWFVLKNKESFSFRKNGPALIFSNKDQYWFKYEKSYRADGPATIFFKPNGKSSYNFHYGNFSIKEEKYWNK